MTTYTSLTDNPDTYTATLPDEVVSGLGGNDTLRAAGSGSTLYGGDGDDVLNGGAGNDFLMGDGSTGANSLNVLTGLGGNDTLIGLTWNDQIYAGNGDDYVQVLAQQTGQVVDGGGGTDTIEILAFAGVTDPLYVDFGSTFQPVADGIAGATYTGFEQLSIVGGTGGNTFLGGGKNDTLINSYANVNTFVAGTLNGRGGDDILQVNGLTQSGTGIEQVNGGAGTDKFYWSNGFASGFDLVINGTTGVMKANGTTFLKFQQVEALNITTFSGFTGAISFTGMATADVINVSATTIDAKMGDGNDTATIGLGDATVQGGAGDDIISQVSSATGTMLFQGGDGNDSLSSGFGQARLEGGAGNDYLGALNAHSVLLGGTGDDRLYISIAYSSIGTGAITVDGGAGHDQATLEFGAYQSAFTGDLSAASLTLANGALVTGVEAITFSAGAGADSLSSSNDLAGVSANVILGNAGNDTLQAASHGARLDGGGDNDSLLGGAGNDSLNGNIGNDTLSGGGGNDTLVGYFGTDVLTGGNGADLFVFNYTTETSTTLGTADTITDFRRGQGDKIDLHNLHLYTTGQVPLSFIGSQSFHHTAGEVRFETFDLAGTANDHTQITVDLNGDATADMLIDVTGLVTFKASDFLLV